MHHASLQKDGGMIMSNRPGGGNSLVIFPKRQGFVTDDEEVVILRHSNLPTTQRYLGMTADTEAMRWIETGTPKRKRSRFWSHP
jgi:hypothetical protein